MNLELIRPAERYRESFLSAAREFREKGLSWWVGGDLEIAETDSPRSCEKRLGDESRRTETVVPNRSISPRSWRERGFAHSHLGGGK